MSKGISNCGILIKHVLRNTLEDLFSVLPKATNIAITSMVIVEVIMRIKGLGGIIMPNVDYMPQGNAMVSIFLVLAALSLLLQAIYAIFRKLLVVRIKEVS